MVLPGSRLCRQLRCMGGFQMGEQHSLLRASQKCVLALLLMFLWPFSQECNSTVVGRGCPAEPQPCPAGILQGCSGTQSGVRSAALLQPGGKWRLLLPRRPGASGPTFPSPAPAPTPRQVMWEGKGLKGWVMHLEPGAGSLPGLSPPTGSLGTLPQLRLCGLLVACPLSEPTCPAWPGLCPRLSLSLSLGWRRVWEQGEALAAGMSLLPTLRQCRAGPDPR